jgi:hypothetical protein
MATRQNETAEQTNPLSPVMDRAWNEFALLAFARIVARKHGVIVPNTDADSLSSLSNEELEKRLRLVSELAHLPPA